MGGVALSGAVAVFAASIVLNFLVLAYRWPATARVRAGVDAIRRRITGRSDWEWLKLWHLVAVLLAIAAANVAWNVATLRCGDDSLAVLASGRAALAGHNPFSVTYCGGTVPDQIPYGLAEVGFNALAALSGSVAGVWIVWTLLALAVVPLVWAVGGPDRRYLAVLTATSVLYLPNIATNIGVENAIVPVAVLIGLGWMGRPGGRGAAGSAVAAFLSTARFPALFPLLGVPAPLARGRTVRVLGVLAVFLGAAAAAYLAWGWDAIGIVYLNQFARLPAESLNVFAVLLVKGWVLPSFASAAVQGAVILGLLVLVHARRYGAAVAAAVPLLGVMLLSQYLTFNFVLWIVPLVLLGDEVNRWLFVYGTIALVDQNLFLFYVADVLGVWWPYEVAGIVLTAVLVYLLVRILRTEERRRRARPAAEAGGPAPTA